MLFAMPFCRMQAENPLDAESMNSRADYLTVISLMREINIDTSKLVLGHSSMSTVRLPSRDT